MLRPTKSQIEAEIIDCAAGLFAKHSFSHTSVQQIADTVGYSKTGLLHHFPSKQAIYDAVVKALREHVREVRDNVKSLPVGRARDLAVVEEAVDFSFRQPGVSALSNRIALDPNLWSITDQYGLQWTISYGLMAIRSPARKSMEPPMDVLHGPFAVIRKHRKAFLTLNVAFYGLFAVSMAITMLLPEIQAYLKTGIDEAYLRPGVLKTVADAYGSQNLPKAMGMTFIINLLVAFVMTTLPSLIIPFIGILATLHRGILWGIMFAPLGAHKAMLIPHSITLLIEGQAYVLAAFGAYVHGRTFLRISEYRVSTRWEAWKAGLVPLANIYCLVILALAVAAIYEVLEAIYIIPRII